MDPGKQHKQPSWSQQLDRVFYPVHVYIHYTDTHNYMERMLRIRDKLTGTVFFPFPVTCTAVQASVSEAESGLFDVYVVGGFRRFRLSIAEGSRVPSAAEVIDTVGWAGLRSSSCGGGGVGGGGGNDQERRRSGVSSSVVSGNKWRGPQDLSPFESSSYSQSH